MNNEKTNKMSESIKSILDGVSTIVDTKKVIGEPYTVGETTIIPFIETSIALGVGDFNVEKDCGAMGCKISPLACLIIKNGVSKVVHLQERDSLNRLIELLPDVLEKIKGKEQISDADIGIANIKSKYSNL